MVKHIAVDRWTVTWPVRRLAGVGRKWDVGPIRTI